MINPPYSEIYGILEGCPSSETRFGPAREWFGAKVEFTPGHMVHRKNVNDALGFMEICQIVGGIFSAEDIARVAPKSGLTLFSEEWAYGPRIIGQLPALIEALRRDPLTRQAVLWFGKPDDGPGLGLPCTVSMQFQIRDGLMLGQTVMRSWDATRGLTYDIMWQGALTMILARILGVEPGLCQTFAGNLHLYESQAAKRPIELEKRFYFEDYMPTDLEGWVSWGRAETKRMIKQPLGVAVVRGDDQ